MDVLTTGKEPPPSAASNIMKKRFLVIANPHSGKRCSDTAIDTIQSGLRAQGFESHVRMTEHANHARQIVTEACLDEYVGLCLFGGDGTFHEVVSGLMQRGDRTSIPLGILPGGTGNDVVRHLGIESIQDGIKRILAGHTRPFDVAKVETGGETHYSTALVGWNAVAEVNRLAERFRSIGPSRYAIAALLQVLGSSPRPATLVLDTERFEDEFLLVAACNTPYIGGGMRFAPRALTDDGKLDVIIVRQASRWQLLRLFLNMFNGKHVGMEGVEYYQTSSLRIEANESRPLDIDGEVKGSAPVSIEILPSELQIFC